MTDVHHSIRLLTAGWLPGWLGLLLFAAAAAFVLWQLRRDFARTRPTLLTRWVLPDLRLLIVGLFAWLLCRPELLIRKRWQEPPEVLVLVDGGPGMKVAERPEFLHETLDAMEAAGLETFAQRQRAGTHFVAVGESLVQSLARAGLAFRDDLERLKIRLPPAPDFGVRIDTLGRDAAEAAARLDVAKAELPAADAAGKAVAAAETALDKTLLPLATLLRTLAADAAPVRENAATHPDLLERHAGKLDEALAAARLLLPTAHALQDQLDERFLGREVLERCRTARVTRSDLAARAATTLATGAQAGFAVRRTPVVPAPGQAPGSAALTPLLDARLRGALAAAVYLGDGTAAWTPAELEQLPLLGNAPVHTILVGRDGIAPADAGIVAVDAPPVTVSGRTWPLRVLAHCTLAKTAGAQLRVTGDNGAALASLPVPENAAGEVVLEVPVTLTRAGRNLLTVELTAAQGDAVPGNERIAVASEVIPAGTRTLVVSGRFGGDAGSWAGILTQLGFEPVDLLVSEPGLRELNVGPDPGGFPASAEQWKGVGLAILTGPVPVGLPETALAGLKQAVNDGLRVLLQDETPAQSAPVTWATALGLATQPDLAPGRLQAAPAPWHTLYQLGPDLDSSRARMAALPLPGPARYCTDAGTPLLVTAAGAPVKLAPRGKGLILYCGLPRLGRLRADGNDATVNRIMSQLIGLALATGTEAGAAAPAGAEPPRRRAEFALTPSAANLAAVANATGGTALTLTELPRVAKLLPKPEPMLRQSARRVPLWTGVWPLVALLGLVSAEYVLRRRAGRVM